MKWLNYNHLYYFWTVARHGSMVRAAEELMISQPTVSAQVKDLEQSLKRKLLVRAGRGMTLTEAGRVVFNYANEIFSLGQELLSAMEAEPAGMPLRLKVGIVDMIPKTVVRKLLEPAMKLSQAVRLVCHEDKSERLLGDLAARRLDVVLSDAPIGASVQLRGTSHLLAECGVTFFGTAKLAALYGKKFPRSLDGAPMLLPTAGTGLRRELDLWFDAKRIHPRVIAEFDDGATLASFGRAGMGIFPAPDLVEDEIRRELGVRVVGRSSQISERFFAISAESRLQNPAVAAICSAAPGGSGS